MNCLYLAASCVACYLMDKLGRRSLMIYSFTGMVSLFYTGSKVDMIVSHGVYSVAYALRYCVAVLW